MNAGRVLVAMSGGVDSSVAAALLQRSGWTVVGATMKLWGGDSDSGCCSVADVEDARRVAQQLGIDHHVFNFSRHFDAAVVDPYVADHAAGRTPNPCIACNRHLKFDRFLRRAEQLGFDAIATGHHARVVSDGDSWRLVRGHDRAKDQSYVLHMLGQHALSRTLLPVGEFTKAEVRDLAASLGLRTATKPDSQDVCFISRTGGRQTFLGDRIPLRPGRVVDTAGAPVGQVPAIELVTIGQRRGLGVPGPPVPVSPDGLAQRRPVTDRRYVVDVDVPAGVVTVGSLDDLLVDELAVTAMTWVDRPVPDGAPVEVQASAHGEATVGRWRAGPDVGSGRVELGRSQRRVAPGQSVVLYARTAAGDAVVGGGLAG